MKTKLVEVTVITILILICFGLFKLWQSERNDRQRLYSDVIQISNVNKDIYTQLLVKTKELNKIVPKIDSISKANNIKPKNIEKIISYEHKLFIDTVKFSKPKPKYDSTNRVIIAMAIDKCFTSEGIINLEKTNLYPTDEDVSNIDFKLQNTTSIDTGKIIYYAKRDTTKLLRFWPFAKMKYYTKNISECNGEIKIQEIQITK